MDVVFFIQALGGNLITLCLNELDDSDPVLRQWLAICLGRIWDKHEDARFTRSFSCFVYFFLILKSIVSLLKGAKKIRDLATQVSE